MFLSCTLISLARNRLYLAIRIFRLIDLYSSFIFNPQFMDEPVRTCRNAVTNAVRSTSFLSAFVGIFQVFFPCTFICIYTHS